MTCPHSEEAGARTARPGEPPTFPDRCSRPPPWPTGYGQGACMLHHLRDTLGAAALRLARRAVLEQNRYGVVEPAEFRRVMQHHSRRTRPRCGSAGGTCAGEAPARTRTHARNEGRDAQMGETMTHHGTSHRPPGGRRLFLGIWAAMLLLVAGLAAPAAQASHHNTSAYQTHLNSMHYTSAGGGAAGPLDEQYCVQVYGSSYLSHTGARNFLKDTLINQGDRDWDGTGGWRIDLWLAPDPCTSYPAQERAEIELEYHYAADWSSVCGGSYGYYNCAVSQNPVYNSDYGHTDYRWKVLYMVDSSGGQLNARGRAFINHETGHAWGLLDPRWDGDCHTPSIMHGSYTYGCQNWQNWWPSSYDFASVVASMNGN